MKSLGKKGFTLIELLAVITIMGILMLVAIPAVSRTIENSRRDTFADLGKTYINTIRNAVIADELTCGSTTVGATTVGTYYFKIGTQTGDSALQQTTDIMEKIGKSSWGSSDVKGYVKWVNAETTASGSTTGNVGFKTTYSVYLIDEGLHGMTETAENSISRSSVKTKVSGVTAFSDVLQVPTKAASTDPDPVECTLK